MIKQSVFIDPLLCGCFISRIDLHFTAVIKRIWAETHRSVSLVWSDPVFLSESVLVSGWRVRVLQGVPGCRRGDQKPQVTSDLRSRGALQKGPFECGGCGCMRGDVSKGVGLTIGRQ